MGIERDFTIEQSTNPQDTRSVPAHISVSERIERKFFILPSKLGFAYTLLRQVCRPDREYPAGQVNSLYFDSPDLDQYTRSSSGELKKDKVRIRWYDRIEDYQGTVPVFVELKSRLGFASSKKRERLLVPAEHLTENRLGAGIIDRTTLAGILARFGHFPEKPLRPVILISYWRYRFTEMLTGVRVSFDHSIRSTAFARELGYGEQDLPLPGGVIEVKGQSIELPVTLRRMRLLDIDWSRFSKYSHCIEAHLSQPGTMSRLWPSGRTIET